MMEQDVTAEIWRMGKQLTLITHGLICLSSMGIFEKMFYMQFTLDAYFVLAML